MFRAMFRTPYANNKNKIKIVVPLSNKRYIGLILILTCCTCLKIMQFLHNWNYKHKWGDQNDSGVNTFQSKSLEGLYSMPKTRFILSKFLYIFSEIFRLPKTSRPGHPLNTALVMFLNLEMLKKNMVTYYPLVITYK